jgi:hypothetical protein
MWESFLLCLRINQNSKPVSWSIKLYWALTTQFCEIIWSIINPLETFNLNMYFSVKTCLVFVVYLDNHCQAQELSNDLPGSYETEEIFHSGSINPLDLRPSFYTREGRALGPSLFFSAHSLLPLCLGTSKTRNPSPILIARSWTSLESATEEEVFQML